MDKLPTSLNYNTVVAINRMWPHMPIEETTQGKIDKSILSVVAEKFIKKQFARAGKNHTKDFTMSLHYFEVATLERYLRNNVHLWPTDSLEYSLIHKYKNQIHPLI